MSRLQELIAYHEAGHAVAAVALGVAVESVTIRAEPLTAGNCRLADTPTDAQRRLIDAAGTAAVELYERGGSVELNRRLAGRKLDPTLCKVASIFNQTPPQFAEAHNRKCGDGANFPDDKARHAAAVEVSVLLIAHWPAVSVLAAELVNVGTVEGERVRSIVNDLPPATRKALAYDARRAGWMKGKAATILPAPMPFDATAERRAAISRACVGSF